MNALTKASNTSVAGAGFANPFAAAGAGAGSTTYMKFKGASGDFLAGQDEDEIPHGTKLAGDVDNSKWVWSFWWEGDVLETQETLIIENPLGFDQEPDELPEGYDGDMTLEEIRAEQANRDSNFMDGWSCQAVFGLREIGGENEEYTLKLNQGVALNAFRAMLQTYGRQFRFKEGLVPVIELSARSYKSKNKSVGKRFSPILKIVDWLSEEDLMNATGDDPDMYDEPEVKEEPRRAARPAIAPPKEEAVEPEAESEGNAAPVGRAARGRRGANYG